MLNLESTDDELPVEVPEAIDDSDEDEIDDDDDDDDEFDIAEDDEVVEKDSL